MKTLLLKPMLIDGTSYDAGATVVMPLRMLEGAIEAGIVAKSYDPRMKTREEIEAARQAENDRISGAGPMFSVEMLKGDPEPSGVRRRRGDPREPGCVVDSTGRVVGRGDTGLFFKGRLLSLAQLGYISPEHVERFEPIPPDAPPADEVPTTRVRLLPFRHQFVTEGQEVDEEGLITKPGERVMRHVGGRLVGDTWAEAGAIVSVPIEVADRWCDEKSAESVDVFGRALKAVRDLTRDPNPNSFEPDPPRPPTPTPGRRRSA